MAELQHLTADDSLTQIADALDRDGACIVEGLLTGEACDDLMADFEPYLNEMEWGVDELGYKDQFYGNQTKRLHGLFSKSRHMADVLTHSKLVGIARTMIVERNTARDLRLSNTELMVLGNNQGLQDFHTDGGSWYRAQKLDPNETLVSANIALTDFTASNGATRVVPGSHVWEEMREPQAEEICLATMPKGSALIYAGRVVHSGGANTEAQVRPGLYLGYVASWLRPIENQLVTNDPADIFALPEEAQRLLDVSPGGFTVIA